MFSTLRGKLTGTTAGKLVLLLVAFLAVRWLVQHPWVVITAVALALATAIAVGGLLWTRRDRI